MAIDETASASDVDSRDYDGGFLKVDFLPSASNPTSQDRLTIRSVGSGDGEIDVDGNQARYGGTEIGTFSGGVGSSTLEIQFNVNATVDSVQVLMRHIQYDYTGDDLNSQPRIVRFLLDDGDKGLSESATQTLQVIPTNDAPVITTTRLPNGTEDVAYNATISASDVDPGDTLTLSAVSVPAWMHFTDQGDGKGILTGTPGNLDSGSHSVTVKVTDAEGSHDQQTITFEVDSDNDAPSITSTPVTSAVEDSRYQYTVLACAGIERPWG